jgi:hypothetical protein
MRRVSSIVTFIGVVLVASSVHAGQIASPSVFGSWQQASVQCTVGNTGSTPLNVVANIVDESGNVVPTSSHCGTIEGNFLCQIFASSISTTGAFACTATTSGSVAKLRGDVVIFDSGGFPLRTAELR